VRCRSYGTCSVSFGGQLLGDVVKSIAGVDRSTSKAMRRPLKVYMASGMPEKEWPRRRGRGAATKELSEYALAVAASQIVLLVIRCDVGARHTISSAKC